MAYHVLYFPACLPLCCLWLSKTAFGLILSLPSVICESRVSYRLLPFQSLAWAENSALQRLALLCSQEDHPNLDMLLVVRKAILSVARAWCDLYPGLLPLVLCCLLS